MIGIDRAAAEALADAERDQQRRGSARAPQRNEKSPKPIIAAMNTCTVAEARASQPVSGTQIASATA